MNGQEFSGDDWASGVGGGSLQEGLHSLLSFLSAFAEAVQYRERMKCEEVENDGLFPVGLEEWAVASVDEIGMLATELEEKSGECIIE